jgi:hypothetical protein
MADIWTFSIGVSINSMGTRQFISYPSKGRLTCNSDNLGVLRMTTYQRLIEERLLLEPARSWSCFLLLFLGIMPDFHDPSWNGPLLLFTCKRHIRYLETELPCYSYFIGQKHLLVTFTPSQSVYFNVVRTS